MVSCRARLLAVEHVARRRARRTSSATAGLQMSQPRPVPWRSVELGERADAGDPARRRTAPPGSWRSGRTAACRRPGRPGVSSASTDPPGGWARSVPQPAPARVQRLERRHLLGPALDGGPQVAAGDVVARCRPARRRRSRRPGAGGGPGAAGPAAFDQGRAAAERRRPAARTATESPTSTAPSTSPSGSRTSFCQGAGHGVGDHDVVADGVGVTDRRRPRRRAASARVDRSAPVKVASPPAIRSTTTSAIRVARARPARAVRPAEAGDLADGADGRAPWSRSRRRRRRHPARPRPRPASRASWSRGGCRRRTPRGRRGAVARLRRGPAR